MITGLDKYLENGTDQSFGNDYESVTSKYEPFQISLWDHEFDVLIEYNPDNLTVNDFEILAFDEFTNKFYPVVFESFTDEMKAEMITMINKVIR